MRNPQFESCMEACQECMEACETCATQCLHEDDVKMMVRCIELDRSCADLCALALREMARGSEFATRICALCAELCQVCGDECAQHHVEHCQQCAHACYHCAEECHRMAESHVGAAI